MLKIHYELLKFKKMFTKEELRYVFKLAGFTGHDKGQVISDIILLEFFGQMGRTGRMGELKTVLVEMNPMTKKIDFDLFKIKPT